MINGMTITFNTATYFFTRSYLWRYLQDIV